MSPASARGRRLGLGGVSAGKALEHPSTLRGQVLVKSAGSGLGRVPKKDQALYRDGRRGEEPSRRPGIRQRVATEAAEGGPAACRRLAAGAVGLPKLDLNVDRLVRVSERESAL